MLLHRPLTIRTIGTLCIAYGYTPRIPPSPTAARWATDDRRGGLRRPRLRGTAPLPAPLPRHPGGARSTCIRDCAGHSAIRTPAAGPLDGGAALTDRWAFLSTG